MEERNYEYIFEKGDNVQFSVIDYVVFAITLGLSASIGLFYAIKDRRSQDTEDFLLGGRSLHVIPVSLSLLSSFISAITLLGTPAEVYRYNTMYWWVSVAFVVTGIGSAHIFIPVFYNLGVTSIFEYVELRFGRLTRIVSSVLYLIWMLLYMAIVLYGPSLALNAVTGISLWGSIIAVSLVCIFYTTLGNMDEFTGHDSYYNFSVSCWCCNVRLLQYLIPLFAMDLVGHLHGLPGLILSCVFSGSLSTISSGLNAASAVILEDFVKPCCCYGIKPFWATLISKLTVIIAGLVCLALAFLVSKIGAILQAAYTLHGILGGPLLGLFTLGMVFPWSNKWGAITGPVTALGFMLWIGLGAKGVNMSTTIPPTTLAMNTSMTTMDITDDGSEPFILYKLSYMWYSATAMLTTVIVGLIVSFATGYTKPDTVDPRLICHIFDVFFPFLPEQIRRPLRFGVREKQKLMTVTIAEIPVKYTVDDGESELNDDNTQTRTIEGTQ
ncbi:hypothetical protein KUTeg_004302, partial [Tegillarca granosa]